MIRILFLVSLIFFLLLDAGPSLSFETQGQDCSKCHQLSREEARDLLKDILPNIKILDIRLSPTKALWEIFSESGGRKGLVYVDLSKKHLVLGNIFSIKERKNLTQERMADLNKVDVSQIPLADALVMGDPKARIRIIAFDDPDWPYCAKLHQEMKKIVAERKDIAFFLKMSPLKSHPAAYEKAKAIVCEKSLTLLEDAHEKKPLPKPSCETSVIDENMKLAERLGLSSVPVLIFPDGRVMPGYKDAKTLLDLIGN